MDQGYKINVDGNWYVNCRGEQIRMTLKEYNGQWPFES